TLRLPPHLPCSIWSHHSCNQPQWPGRRSPHTLRRCAVYCTFYRPHKSHYACRSGVCRMLCTYKPLVLLSGCPYAYPSLSQICVQGTFGNLVKPASATASVVGVPDTHLDTINVGYNLAAAIELQVAALGAGGVVPNLIIAKHISSPIPCAIAQPQQRCSSTGRWRKRLATF